MTCLIATREPRTINLSIAGERITFYYVASQPRTSDRLISHWRALCLLAHDNWRCSIQPEIFHSSKFCLSRDSISVRQRESPVCLPLDYTCYISMGARRGGGKRGHLPPPGNSQIWGAPPRII